MLWEDITFTQIRWVRGWDRRWTNGALEMFEKHEVAITNIVTVWILLVIGFPPLHCTVKRFRVFWRCAWQRQGKNRASATSFYYFCLQDANPAQHAVIRFCFNDMTWFKNYEPKNFKH